MSIHNIPDPIKRLIEAQNARKGIVSNLQSTFSGQVLPTSIEDELKNRQGNVNDFQRTAQFQEVDKVKPDKRGMLLAGGIAALGGLLGARNAQSSLETFLAGEQGRADVANQDAEEAEFRRFAQAQQADKDNLVKLQGKRDAALNRLTRSDAKAAANQAQTNFETVQAEKEASRIADDKHRTEVFNQNTLQFGLVHALNVSSTEFKQALQKDPFKFINEQAATLSGATSGEEYDTARRGLMADIIIGSEKAKWMGKTLEQDFDIGAKKLEEITNLVKDMPAKIAHEVTMRELEIKNIKQQMTQRGEAITKARNAGDTALTAELMKVQMDQAVKRIASARSNRDALRKKLDSRLSGNGDTAGRTPNNAEIRKLNAYNKQIRELKAEFGIVDEDDGGDKALNLTLSGK